MGKYAIIRLKGQQFKVSEGEEILVGKIDEEKPVPEILLVVDNGKVKVGKPKVAEARVSLKIIKGVEKGKKLYVQKYKAKSRYRRKYGFRPVYTRLLVEKIE